MIFFVGGAAPSRRNNGNKNPNKRPSPSQPARPVGRRNQAKPAARPSNNRRNQGQKRKNQGSRLEFDSSGHSCYIE